MKRVNKIKKQCKFCKKKFVVYPSLKRIVCCSQSCAYRQKIQDGLLIGFQKGHIVTNKTKEVIKQRTKEAMKRPEVIAKVKKTWFKKGSKPSNAYPKGRILSPDIERKRVSNSIKANHKKNKIETITELLLPLTFKYVGSGDFFVEKFNPDFIDEQNKLIVEVFGDYWHNRPHQKQIDFYKFKVYKRNGYRCLVIWEHELENCKAVSKRIKTFYDK